MKNPLSRLPWFAGAPAFLGALVVAAVISNYLGADYFKRTRLEEANPLAGVAAAPAGQGAEVASATFRDGEPGHRGEGSAKLLRASDGALTLRLENFSVTNGPDLFVVLSPSADGYAEGALNLGELKATDGNFNYAVPPGTDVTKYKSVVVWCRQFDVTFAVATFGSTAALAPMTQVAVQSASTSTPVAPSPAGTSPSPAATQAAQPTPTAAPTQAPAAPTVTPSGPQVLAQGSFRDGEPGHRGSGTAKLGRDAAGKPVIVFENFSVTNGPDLRVILSSNPNGSGQGIDLGKLKATDGTFSYAIPEGTDLSQVKSVTIWCAAFPTIFAYATFGA